MHKNNVVSRGEEMSQIRFDHERLLIHQARHAAMGEMLGTIAHQWRQPLNIISLVVQNMKDSWECGEFNDEFLERSVFQLMAQVMGLSRTIDDFRMFLDPEKTTDLFDPVCCVEEIVGLLSGSFPNYPAIEILNNHLEETDVRITGCYNSFSQVIFNLLNNAKDAVQEQQHRAGPAYRGHVAIEFQRLEDDLAIFVSDNGGGIAESAIEHVFEPYFTTKRKNNGVGTGLYISKIIIENSMNGRLWVENIPNGALLGVRLPYVTVDRRDV